MGNKYFNCGDSVGPSSCINFTGGRLSFLSDDKQLDCNANLDDVIDALDIAINNIQIGNDLTLLDKGSLNFDPATINIKNLHQVEINYMSGLNAQINTLSEQLNNLNIGSEIITINLGNLTPSAAACAVGTNMYSLISLLNLIFNTLNSLQDQINNL